MDLVPGRTAPHKRLMMNVAASTLAVGPLADEYKRIGEISDDVTRAPATYTGLIAPEPVQVSEVAWASFVHRNDLIRGWQRCCAQLVGASIDGDAAPTIASAVLDHLPVSQGLEHHRAISVREAGIPAFFRTDQASDGTILEVQCPGSLWGVHEILSEYYRDRGSDLGRASSLAGGFVEALHRRLGARPIVHHILDNSSHPAGERFFIQRARRGTSYFGYDDVRPADCNFVRAHDFPSLLVENFAAERLARHASGSRIYDLPPVALFDQKLLRRVPVLGCHPRVLLRRHSLPVSLHYRRGSRWLSAAVGGLGDPRGLRRVISLVAGVVPQVRRLGCGAQLGKPCRLPSWKALRHGLSASAPGRRLRI